MEWQSYRTEGDRTAKIVIAKLGGPLPVNEVVGTGPFMHQPSALSALKGACTWAMFLCSCEQRPAMVAGEINGQFGHVHPDSMRVNLRDA
jgi:hypothetical protein